MKTITNAASLDGVGTTESRPGSSEELIYNVCKDSVYNMRDDTTGLNIDFMSYAAYADVGYDPTALLDAKTLAERSQKVFSTYFQHFMSNNISSEYGNWVLQPIGQQLHVGPPMSFMPTQYAPGGSLAPNFEDFARNTSRTVTVTISSYVEMLRINTVAFWIATSILTWLLITIGIFASVQQRYYGGMMRNVECIADILVLIAGSERLLTAIRENGIDTILKRIAFSPSSDGSETLMVRRDGGSTSLMMSRYICNQFGLEPNTQLSQTTTKLMAIMIMRPRATNLLPDCYLISQRPGSQYCMEPRIRLQQDGVQRRGSTSCRRSTTRRLRYLHHLLGVHHPPKCRQSNLLRIRYRLMNL